MARPLRIEFPGAFYHVTSRGNEQKNVFKSRRDREQFLHYLESATIRYGAVIHVYCLMGNHYHLLLETPEGNLSRIMRHINGAYTTYFNVKRSRAGHLFQGRYKSILVDADEYALELSRYIHLNPVRAGMVTTPEDYSWSSFRSYIEQNCRLEWLTTDFLLSYFKGTKEATYSQYQQFVKDRLHGEYESPLNQVVASTMLGTSKFVEEVTERHLSELNDRRVYPALGALKQRASLDDILATVGALGLEDEKLVRNLSLYCCRKYSGKSLKDIGDRFGISDSAVSQACRRLALKAEADQPLKNLISQVADRITCIKS